ncbi:MAG: hypothetical protein ACRCVD_08375 [Halioglobus sp.]
MSSFFQGTDPDVDPGNAQQSAQLAQDWAIKMDGPVEGADYSAEYNASLAATSAGASAASAQAAAQSAQDAADAAADLGSLLLGDLVDVSVPAPADGDILVWSSANSQWEAAPAALAMSASTQALWDKIVELESKLVAAGVFV